MKKFVKLVLIVGVIAVIAKFVAAKMAGKMAEWEGLTESEVRAKLESGLPKKVPGEKRAAVADKVVAGMRERGALRDEDPADTAPADTGADEMPDADDSAGSETSDDVAASV